MNNKISVIIPVYNSSSTLDECLKSVFNNKCEKEVIIVSDNSLDDSVNIAKKYNCKIVELTENKGPANARNVGASHSECDILFFIDSDVIIKDSALSIIRDNFLDLETNVIQGIYSNEPNYSNLTTQYQQSFYSYYTFNESKEYISTLVTCCFAIKKEIFFELKGFNINIKNATSEDEEFGFNLIEKGYNIKIFKEINVYHKVDYNLRKFIFRNFRMYNETMKSFLRKKTLILPLEFVILKSQTHNFRPPAAPKDCFALGNHHFFRLRRAVFFSDFV